MSDVYCNHGEKTGTGCYACERERIDADFSALHCQLAEANARALSLDRELMECMKERDALLRQREAARTAPSWKNALEARVAELEAALRAEQAFDEYAAKWNSENEDEPGVCGYVLADEYAEALHTTAEALRHAALSKKV